MISSGLATACRSPACSTRRGRKELGATLPRLPHAKQQQPEARSRVRKPPARIGEEPPGDSHALVPAGEPLLLPPPEHH